MGEYRAWRQSVKDPARQGLFPQQTGARAEGEAVRPVSSWEAGPEATWLLEAIS